MNSIISKIKEDKHKNLLLTTKITKIERKTELNDINKSNPFEIIEMVRKTMNDDCEAYFLEYENNNIYLCSGELIYLEKSKWETLFREEESLTKEEILKKIYKEFQEEVKKIDSSFNNTNFYFDKYNKLNLDEDILSQLKNGELDNKIREEVSSMAIVFFKDKVLALETIDNKFVIPKGHIENKETPVETAIRECFEETGVMIYENDFITMGNSFDYYFCGANFKYLTNTAFFEIFKTNKIHKQVFVCIFKINEERPTYISELNNFKKAFFIDINEFYKISSYENTKVLIEESYNILASK